jgi:MoaA/NifB/PqqE/SkfB family radical SAM enzyme
MNYREFKLGLRVIRSNMGLKFKPYKLNFAITYRCNSRCKTCSIWKKRPKNELTLKEIEQIAEKNNYFPWISLTGGEPFLRKDIDKIAKVFYKNSDDFFLLNIPTNGSLVETVVKKIKSFVKTGIPRIIITVSLEGPRDIHNYVRGVPNAWTNAMKTYKEIEKMGKRYNAVDVFFGLTISPFNVGRFLETYASVKKTIPEAKATDFHINLYHTSEHFYGNDCKIKNFLEYKKKTTKEIKVIEKMKGFNIFSPVKCLERSYLKLSKEYVKRGKTPLQCRTIDTSCFLDPFGNVYPCTIFNRRLGNVRDCDYDLTPILKNSESRRAKKVIKEMKCPNCWTPCEAYQMILSNWWRA